VIGLNVKAFEVVENQGGLPYFCSKWRRLPRLLFLARACKILSAHSQIVEGEKLLFCTTASSASAKYVYALSLRLEFRCGCNFPCYFYCGSLVQVDYVTAL
jgi:hypothetical protein